MIAHSSDGIGEDQVFDRPLHLSGVLDNAADELSQTWFGYEWSDRTRCNCAAVARQVLQVSPLRLRKLLPPIYENGVFYPKWSSMTGRFCADTGWSENEVFRRLFAAGLRYSDFTHLEELSDPAILARMEPYRRTQKSVCRSRKSDVVAYLRAWAVGIEEYHDPAPVKAKRTASVPIA